VGDWVFLAAGGCGSSDTQISSLHTPLNMHQLLHTISVGSISNTCIMIRIFDTKKVSSMIPFKKYHYQYQWYIWDVSVSV